MNIQDVEDIENQELDEIHNVFYKNKIYNFINHIYIYLITIS